MNHFMRVRANVGAPSLLLVILVFLSMPLASPGLAEEPPTSSEDVAPYTPQEVQLLLRQDLADFEAALENSMSSLRNMLVRRGMKGAELADFERWQKGQSARLKASLRRDDPVAALLDSWATCAALTQYLAEGDGRDELTDATRAIALDMVRRRRDKLALLAAAYLPPDTYRDLGIRVEKYTTTHPISDQGIAEADPEKLAKDSFSLWSYGQNTVSSIIRLPFLPGRMMKSVARGGEALGDLRTTTANAVDVANRLPEEIRTQIELLFDRLHEQQDEILILFEKAEIVSANVKAIGQQTQAAATQVDASLKTVQEMLPAAQGVCESFTVATTQSRALVDAVGALLEKSEKQNATAPEDGQEGGFDVNAYRDAAQAIEAGAARVQLLLAEIQTMTTRAATTEPSTDDAFDISDYTEAARAIEGGADQIRQALVELRTMSADDTLQMSLLELAAGTEASADRIACRAERLLACLTWRLILLAGALFFMVGALLWWHHHLARWGRDKQA